MAETPHAGAPAADPGDESAFAAGRRQAIRRLRLALLAAVLVPVAAFIGVAAFLYRQAFSTAEQDADAAARIAQQHVSNLLETNQMLLARMLDLVGDDDDQKLLARGAEIHERLTQMARGLPQVQLLLVNGADARPLAVSGVYPPPRHIDYTDREWYLAHRDARGPSLHITERLTSRATGEPFFDMSLRRNLANGSFGGSVHVSLRPEYLTEFFGQIAATVPGLHVQVLRSDGRLLARFPGTPAEGEALAKSEPLAQAIAAGQRSGRFEGTASPADRAVLGAFRKLPAYPIYVSASIARANVFAGWVKSAGLLALFVLPMSLALGWIGWNAARRALESMRQLEEEIARRRRVESALLHAQKLEAMGRLTGGIAHDFNNVLMIVSASAHLLRRLNASAASAPQLDTIDRAVASAARLTRQLLAFSRRQALAPARVSLQERLPALLEVLQPLLGSGVQISLEVDADTRPVFVDAAELELALINCAINAKDAMQNERGCIEIRARNAVPGEAALSEESVVIELHDSGRGIDPAIVDRVLEPFFTTKPPGQGSGLGLAQVQAFCESAGGTVRISPRPGGGGTRVSLYLAAAEAHAQAANVATEAKPAIGDKLDCEILLVEDNSSVAQATESLLTMFGCRVRRVASTQAALRTIDEQPTDLVLSDVEMPGEQDGIALAAALAERRPPVPVVLLTGYASRLNEARQRGFTVLSKPCPPEALREAIGKALAATRR